MHQTEIHIPASKMSSAIRNTSRIDADVTDDVMDDVTDDVTEERGRRAFLSGRGKDAKRRKPKKKPVQFETGHQTYMVLSVVVSVCFNLPMGLLAFFVSVKSSNSFKEGDIRGGHTKARCSLVLSMMGIVVTVTVVMAVVFYIAKKQRELQYRYG